MRGALTTRRALIAGGLCASAIPLRADPTVATLKTADGRLSRVSIWDGSGPRRGIILFSHGALSAPEKYLRLVGPWTRAGFKVMAPLHVDSTDHPDHARYGMLDSWRCRLLDMRALADFASASRYVAAGHSYGALTALTLGGAMATIPDGMSGPLRDPRARLVVAFSPPGPAPGLIAAEGYRGIAVPAFIETGTADNPPAAMGGGDWRAHLTAYDQASPGRRYALVLDGADHYFGGLICRPEAPGPPRETALAIAVAQSLNFMGLYMNDDSTAGARLGRALTTHTGYTLSRK